MPSFASWVTHTIHDSKHSTVTMHSICADWLMVVRKSAAYYQCNVGWLQQRRKGINMDSTDAAAMQPAARRQAPQLCPITLHAQNYNSLLSDFVSWKPCTVTNCLDNASCTCACESACWAIMICLLEVSL